MRVKMSRGRFVCGRFIKALAEMVQKHTDEEDCLIIADKQSGIKTDLFERLEDYLLANKKVKKADKD